MILSVKQIEDHLRSVAVDLLTPFDDECRIEFEKNHCTKETRTFLATVNISEYIHFHRMNG